MVAITWTALGVLTAALFGTLFYLGARIDALILHVDAQGASLGTRIDALTAHVDTGFARIDARLDAHIVRHAS